MGNALIDKPAYRAALVDANGFLTPTWLTWFNQLRAASEQQATAQAALTALSAQVATDETNAAALTARVAAEEVLTAAIQAKAALVQTAIAALELLVTGHTLELGIQQTELDLATASLALLSESTVMDADIPRSWTAEFDELRESLASIDPPRDWSAEFDELREYIASIDPPGNGATGATGAMPSGAANLVLATPDGSSGLSSLRALVPADLPATASVSVNGVLVLAMNGGVAVNGVVLV